MHKLVNDAQQRVSAIAVSSKMRPSYRVYVAASLLLICAEANQAVIRNAASLPAPIRRLASQAPIVNVSASGDWAEPRFSIHQPRSQATMSKSKGKRAVITCSMLAAALLLGTCS